MTTTFFKDSFLADLESLSDHDDDNKLLEQQQHDLVLDDDVDQIESVSRLHKSQSFIHTMQKVEAATGLIIVPEDDDDDPELYQLIHDCNNLYINIDDEIALLHKFIFDKYNLKFRGLDSLVPHPIDYARVVKRIGNEIDLNHVHLGDLLPSKNCMIVSLAGTFANAKPLPDNVLEKTLEACDMVITLDSAKNKLLVFLESRMRYIAPNLSAVVGTAVAAKLICSTGGLSQLVKKSDVKPLGSKKKNLAGFSTATSELHVGYLEESEIFQNTPPAFRIHALRLLASKSILAARVDFIRGHRTGNYGTALRDEINTMIKKSQELPPARQIKSLPVPDLNSKKKRGGKRYRKTKERYSNTELRKQLNRMEFGVTEESSLGDGVGVAYGMLGQAGSGKLRRIMPAEYSKVVTKKLKQQHMSSSHSGRSAGGLTSSLAFTPVQGIELLNPLANKVGAACGTQSSYFSESGTFSRIRRT